MLLVVMLATTPMTLSSFTARVTLPHADGQSQRQPYDTHAIILWQFPFQIPWLINSAQQTEPLNHPTHVTIT